MKLDELTTEEIKDIMKQLLYKVEADKKVVDKNMEHRNVYKFHDAYFVNFYNGYEYKVCSIDDIKVDISSESFITNSELSKFYRQLLSAVLSAKENTQTIDL